MASLCLTNPPPTPSRHRYVTSGALQLYPTVQPLKWILRRIAGFLGFSHAAAAAEESGTVAAAPGDSQLLYDSSKGALLLPKVGP